MFAAMATSLLRTDDNIATPCSVKAKGIYFVCLFCCLNSEVTDCDLELIINELCSSFVKVNIKSGGYELFGLVSIHTKPEKYK